jgi:hypothetical protein
MLCKLHKLQPKPSLFKAKVNSKLRRADVEVLLFLADLSVFDTDPTEDNILNSTYIVAVVSWTPSNADVFWAQVYNNVFSNSANHSLPGHKVSLPGYQVFYIE